MFPTVELESATTATLTLQMFGRASRTNSYSINCKHWKGINFDSEGGQIGMAYEVPGGGGQAVAAPPAVKILAKICPGCPLLNSVK